MSKRKFSKKEVAISIAAAALAIATVGGAVAIHKDSSNSNTGHSITVEQSDYSKKKEEAIQQIQDAVKDLSDDQQSEIDSSDAGDAPLSESALNEMEKNAEQNQ